MWECPKAFRPYCLVLNVTGATSGSGNIHFWNIRFHLGEFIVFTHSNFQKAHYSDTPLYSDTPIFRHFNSHHFDTRHIRSFWVYSVIHIFSFNTCIDTCTEYWDVGIVSFKCRILGCRNSEFQVSNIGVSE